MARPGPGRRHPRFGTLLQPAVGRDRRAPRPHPADPHLTPPPSDPPITRRPRGSTAVRTRAIAARIAQSVLVVLGVATVTFILLNLNPADPARIAAGRGASAAQVEAVRHALALDHSALHRYVAYLGNAARLDFGHSYVERAPVGALVAARLPATLELLAGAILCEIAIGVPAGIVAALFAGGLVDRAVMAVSFLAASLPQFVIGLGLLVLFGYRLAWFPIGGTGGLSHLVLPSLTLGLVGAAWYGRVLRSSMIEALSQQFIEALRAKGAGRARIVLVHALRNAGLPVVTMLGTDIGAFASGAVVVETVFGWPGIGQLTWQSIQRQDVPVIMAVTLIASVAIVAANLAADLLAPLLDPRIGPAGGPDPTARPAR